MTLLSASELSKIKPKQLRHIDVEIQDMGITVRIQELTARQKINLAPIFSESSPLGTGDKMIQILEQCIVDENGKLLFSENAPCQFDDFFSDHSVIEKLFDKASKFIKQTGVDQGEAKKN